MASVYTKQDCISSLREAVRKLETSPTQAEYRELGLSPCVTHICDIVGGWNKAKRAAGIETYEQVGEAYDHVPLYPDSNGYERWGHTHNGVQVEVSVHRLLAVAEHGIDKVDGKQIHHKKPIPWLNTPDNIIALTKRQHLALHILIEDFEVTLE
ncbi:homing endonuclease associated repeat-containing protein [Natrinema gelatinilyticum]|uniref:homing endonuclease associated repeat-containing protein n=1 Tax=Natrinema gelatinilyticum TaxID=2961571 RepID=UPI003CE4A8EF